MRTLKLLFILIIVTLSLPKGVSAQYVQPMRYPHYSITQQANIGVGTVRTTAASAYLEVGPTSGANKGFLPPRLSTTERDAIASPANGLMIYNKTTNDFQGWNGSAWVNFYIDTSASFISYFYRVGDSVKYVKGGVHTFAFKDSTGGGTPTLQQVLTAGSTLTTDNTIDAGTTVFKIGQSGERQLIFDPVTKYWAIGDYAGDFGNAVSIHLSDSNGTVRIDGDLQVQGMVTSNLSSSLNTVFPIFYNSSSQYHEAGSGIDTIWRLSDSIHFRVRSVHTSKAGTFGIYAPTAGASYTFTNGLTESGGTVKLGGTLTEAATIIDADGNEFSIQSNSAAPKAVIYFNGGQQMDLYANNGLGADETAIRIEGDSLTFKPLLGRMNIDTLSTASNMTNKRVMTWDTVTKRWEQISKDSIGGSGGGSTSPGGSDTYVQFNDGGSFGGDAGLVYTKTNDSLVVGQVTVTKNDNFGAATGIVQIKRDVLSATDNIRGFYDATRFSAASTPSSANPAIAYFDGNPTILGGDSIDHVAIHQSRWQTAGTAGQYTDRIYGFVAARGSVGTGTTVGNSYGLYVWQPLAAGTLLNNYGIYIEPLTSGSTTNWGIYNAINKSWLGGETFVTGTLQVNNGTQYGASRITMGGQSSDYTQRIAYYEGTGGTSFYGQGMANPSSGNFGVATWVAATPSNTNMATLVNLDQEFLIGSHVNNGDNKLQVTGNSYISGKLGIGNTAAAARLDLPAGTATAGTAPLKFTSGTNLTTPVDGAMEYNGTNLFFTPSSAARNNILMTSSVNSVSPTSPNRTITVVIDGTTYYIHAKTTND